MPHSDTRNFFLGLAKQYLKKEIFNLKNMSGFMKRFLKNKFFKSGRGRKKYRSKYERIFETIYLSREIAKSELTRIRFLCIVAWLGFLFFSFTYLFFYDEWDALSPYAIKIINVPIFIGLIALYYSLLLLLMKIYKWDEKQEPLLVRVLTICIEAAIPSAFLFFLALPTDLSYVTSAPQVLLYALFFILCTLRLDFRLCLLMGFVSSISYLAVVYHFLMGDLQITELSLALAFPHSHILLKALIIFMTALSAAYVSHQINGRVFDSFAYLQERDTMERLLETHVSSKIANELIYNKNADVGEEYRVSILFLDIRDFTSYAENNTPKDVFAFLNEYLLDMLTVVHKNNGIVNKFLGDGFMAVFGAPLVDEKHAEQAVLSALSIREIMTEKNRKNQVSHVNIGIGIHSGIVLCGNIGSDTRKEYTIIGDTVNIASRVEQLNKKFHSDILVSRATIEKCKHAFPCESVGEHLVKGKIKPVEVFKLL